MWPKGCKSYFLSFVDLRLHVYPKSTNWMPLCCSVKIEIFAPAEGIHLWAQLVVPGLPLWCFGNSWWNCSWWWKSRSIWCPAKFKFQHWLGGQWLHGAVSVCSCKFKFEVESHLANYFAKHGGFASWWSQSKPCPKLISSMWSLVLGFWFEWFWALFVAKHQQGAACCEGCFLCVWGESFIHCVCLLQAGNFNDPTLYKTLRFFVVLTEYSLIFHGVDCWVAPFDMRLKTTKAPPRRPFYFSIFGQSSLRWQFTSQKLSPSCKNQSPTYQEQSLVVYQENLELTQKATVTSVWALETSLFLYDKTCREL